MILNLYDYVKLFVEHSPNTEDEFKRMVNVPYINAIGFEMYVIVCFNLIEHMGLVC